MRWQACTWAGQRGDLCGRPWRASATFRRKPKSSAASQISDPLPAVVALAGPPSMAVRVDRTHVVMALSPVDTNEDHSTSLLVTDRAGGTQQHANGSLLIGTPSHQLSRLPRQPAGGTIYRWNLALSNGEVLTHRRLGPSLAYETGTKPLAAEQFPSPSAVEESDALR